MRSRLAELLVCPKCSVSLQLEIQGRDNEEILAGRLHCSQCRSEFPIRDGIPRFAPSSAYVESFSFEWKRWQRTQFDTESRKLSESTFVVCTGRRPQQLAAKLVLDVGCGTGRFMDVLARAGAETVGLDLSKDFSTFETLGNMGSASLPATLGLAEQAGALSAGDKVALMGIGSGINCLMLAIEW